MHVLIVGGGRTGGKLASFLLEKNYSVAIVEERPEVLSSIHKELPTEIIYEGFPLDMKILEQAGIQHADVLVACTTSNEINLVISYLARMKYHVGKTIVRVNNPHDAWLFTDIFCVDVAVNQAEIMAHLIEEEMFMGNMMTLLKLRRGRYSFVEGKVLPGAKGIGLQIKDLDIEGCVIAGIIREGNVIVPRGVTAFQEGDEVLAVVNEEAAQELSSLIGQPEEEKKG